MGFYIETLYPRHKAAQIINDHDARLTTEPKSFDDVPEGKALICIVHNPDFEAAGFAYDRIEFEVFRAPDSRPRQWLLIDHQLACELTGYEEPKD